MKELCPHYKVVDAYLANLKTERNFPAPANPEMQKQRDTALAGLTSVIEDYKKRYASYKPGSPEQYQKDIWRTIATVLPAWVQYRNTVNEIKITEEKS